MGVFDMNVSTIVADSTCGDEQNYVHVWIILKIEGAMMPAPTLQTKLWRRNASEN